MAQQLETSANSGEKMNDVEGCNDLMSIQEWMKNKGRSLSDKTIEILNDQCIKTINDLKNITEKEMKEYGKEMKIAIGDRSKLVTAIRELAPTKKKVIYLNTDEITMIQSMHENIRNFKCTLNDISEKEKSVEIKRAEIESQINAQFKVISDALHRRQKVLIVQLNAIANKKKNAIRNKVSKYKQSLQQIQNIKENNDEMMDASLEMHQLPERQQKVKQNNTAIIKVINDAKNANLGSITAQIQCNIAANDVVKVIKNLGAIHDANIPILQQLSDDNNGKIQIYWKIVQNDDAKMDENNRKICVEYSLMNGVNDNMEDEKSNWITKEFNINRNNYEGTQCVQVKKIGEYHCRVKYYANKLWSSYSNIKAIQINKICAPVLKWNTKQGTHGDATMVTFVNSNTVKCSYYAVACVDYVINAQDIDTFCFEFQLMDHDTQYVDSAFGFAPYPLDKDIKNVNSSLRDQSYGVYFCGTKYNVFAKGSQQKQSLLPNGAIFKKKDKIGFRIRCKNKTAELFYNGNNLGVVYRQIPDCIIPVISGTSCGGKATLSVMYTTY